jgi:hypothetical protein
LRGQRGGQTCARRAAAHGRNHNLADGARAGQRPKADASGVSVPAILAHLKNFAAQISRVKFLVNALVI